MSYGYSTFSAREQLDAQNKYDSTNHSENVNRRILERENMFNYNTKYGSSSTMFRREHASKKTSTRTGEITGEKFDAVDMQQGMPMRHTMYDTRKYDNYKQPEQNPYLDFDLYTQPQESHETDISYYDPNNSYSNVSDKADKLVSGVEHIEPRVVFSLISNGYSIYLYKQSSAIIKSKFILSPYNILSPFIVLYRGSKGETERELKTFFTFPDKTTVFSGLSEINNSINASSSIFVNNVLLVRDGIELNPAFVKYSASLCSYDHYDRKFPVKESHRINTQISKATNNMITNIVSPNMLDGDKSVILLSSICILPKWKNPFNNAGVRDFKSSTLRKVTMLSLTDKRLKYYEDSLNQVVELDHKDDHTTMGVVLPKDSSRPSLSTAQFNEYSANMKLRELHHIMIPKFKQQNNFDLTSLFKKMGLDDLFKNMDISDIIMNSIDVNVTQIVHQAAIIVDEEGAKPAVFSRSPTNEINFIADHPFIYYIRHIPTNTVLFMGTYL